MKKQKKKLKKLKNWRSKPTAIKIKHRKKILDPNKGCYHPHIDSDGSCCHCGEPDALFKGLKKRCT